MSVRKREWFTAREQREIDDKAKEFARTSAAGGDWKGFRDKAAELLEMKPREAWLVDYRDSNRARAFETFERKKDADTFWAKVKTEVDRGDLVAPRKSETVAEAAGRWIKRVEADGAEQSTLDQYKQHIDIHIRPRIGEIKVAVLTETRLEAFRDELLAKMSRELAIKVLSSTKSILRLAKRGHIAANVKIKADKRKKKLEIGTDIPAPSEIQRLIKASQGEKVELRTRVLLAVAVFTGLRSSELRGLRWRDVDLKGGLDLHVQQRADRYGKIGRLKSKSANRHVDFDQRLAALLKEWKLACPADEADLVFPAARGGAWDNKDIHRKIEPVMRAAGLVTKGVTKFGLHSLRHFFASWCINRKSDGGRELPPKNVQGLLGHSSIVMTLDLYGHLFKGSEDREELSEATAKLWA